jgi:hypothetical protein
VVEDVKWFNENGEKPHPTIVIKGEAGDITDQMANG